MLAVGFLRSLRLPLVSAVTSLPAGTPRLAKCQFFHLRLESQLSYLETEFSCKAFVLRRFRQYAQKLHTSGNRFAIGSTAVCSAVGLKSLGLQHACCADNSQMLADIRQNNWWRLSQYEESSGPFFILLRKLLVPIFLFLYVWMNWGTGHPFIFAAKVVAIFISTNPTPSSLYIFIDQLSDQITSQHPFLHRFKTSFMKAVEVEDYMFFSLAKVKIRDECRILLGILGSWWILPSTP